MITESALSGALVAPVRETLRGCIPFARLSDDEMDIILTRARVARCSRGDHITNRGDPGDSIMVVLIGRVSVSLFSPDGRQVVVSVLRTGSIFGEVSLLDGKERGADVLALSRCEILIIQRRPLWHLLENRLDMCMDMMVILCDRLRHAYQQVEDLAFLDLPSRMAKVLLRLLAESDEDHEHLAVRISQRTLANLAGGSREAVNKYLNIWKEAGVISIEKGTILIRDLSVFSGYTG